MSAAIGLPAEQTAARQHALDCATQRRHDAGLTLQAARRNGLMHPNSCRNSELIAAATTDVIAAQTALDQLALPIVDF